MFLKSILALTQRSPQSRKRTAAAKTEEFTFEALEKREMMAVVGAPWIEGTKVVMQADNSPTWVEVVPSGSQIQVIDFSRHAPRIWSFNELFVDVIEFRGGAAKDRFVNHVNTVSVRAFGNGGDDYLEGAGGNDLLVGGPGNDTIKGNRGNNTIYGGIGDDIIYGGSGNDSIYGGAGEDTIFGGHGNDTIYGGDHRDTIYGGAGNDRIYGGDGNDLLYGGQGADFLFGGDGNDELYGGAGNDRLYGGAGNDILHGGEGTDRAWGDSGMNRYFNTIAYVPAGNNQQYQIDVSAGSFATAPYGSPQNDGWSCGPNSAFRFIQHYGKGISFATVRAIAQTSHIQTEFGLGLRPVQLRNLIHSFNVSASIRAGVNLDMLLSDLTKGRPVIALVQVGTRRYETKIMGRVVATTTIPRLHWVLVNGFDAQSRKVFYTDTDGKQYETSYGSFYSQWNWSPNNFNKTVRSTLYSAGLTGRTYIV